MEITDNEALERLEVSMEGEVAFLQYRIAGRVIQLLHTEVPESFQGRGIAGQLAREGFEMAKRKGLRVLVLCPFVRTWLKRHAEYEPMVTRDL